MTAPRAVALAACAALCTAAAAHAGGVERSTQSMNILFEPGRYVEFGGAFVRPRVSGTAFTVGSGNVLRSFVSPSLAIKMPLTNDLDLAVILDTPIGADTAYPLGTGYALAGTTAKLDSTALTTVLRYRFGNGFSVHGGVRLQQTRGRANVEFGAPLPAASYALTTNNDRRAGFLIGGAWERPELAQRVAVTYNSRITHKFDATEVFGGVSTFPGAFNTTVPESLNIEFQTGIAPGTLLFGSIRWQRWSKFDITPPAFATAFSQPLVDFTRDSTALNLGVGRRMTDNLSLAASVGYERGNGLPTGNIGPVHGRRSIGLGATWTEGPMKITGGISYTRFGNANTTIGANFAGNSAVGAAIRVGFSF